MKGTLESYKKREFHVFVAQTFPKLIILKKEGDKESFNKLILKILPSIKTYINGRLSAAIKNGHFPKNKYKANEFVDQLFIEVYEHIEEVKIAGDFYLWLFKKTDQLLEDVITEEEFDDQFFKNIDDYSKPEWDAMEEKYSTDGGGDLLMIEELDDMSYNHNDYSLNHVFIEDDEQDYIDKLDKELSETEAQNHIKMVLDRLPINMRTVFELFTDQQFTLEEISKIKGIAIDKAEKLLQDARNSIRASLLNRYLIDN